MFAKLFYAELLLFVILDYSKQNALEDVGTLISGFSEITDSGTDVMEKIEKMSTGVFSLTKLAGPIGQLVHAVITVSLQEDSDELIAIQKLNAKLTAKFDELSHKLDDMITRMEYGNLIEFYQNKITMNIGVFEHQISKFLKSRSTEAKEHLKGNCQDITSSPIKLLMWIHGKVNHRQACTLPNAIENRVYARAQALLGKIDERLVQENKNDLIATVEYNKWKMNLLYSLTELPYIDAIKSLINIERGVSNDGSINFGLVETITDLSERLVEVFKNIAFKSLYAGHGREKRDTFNCLLKSITMAYERKRDPLLDISKMIITDVVKLEFIGIMCAGIIAEGNPTDYAEDLNKYESLTKKIADSMKKWITAELNAVWPDVIASHIERSVGTETIKESDYERLAHKIQHQANERGNASYLYQIVVGPNWERERYFHEECEPEECVTVSKSGVKVVISRYNNYEPGLIERLRKSREWIQKNRSNVIERFEEQLNLLGGNAMLVDFVHGVSAAMNFNFLVGHNHWRQLVVLHNRKWFQQSCNIRFAIAGSKIGGVEAYDASTDVFVTSAFSVANRYRLILMI